MGIWSDHILSRRGPKRWPPENFWKKCCCSQPAVAYYYYKKPGVKVACCSNEVPTVLTATISQSGGDAVKCACFAGPYTIQLTYSAVSWSTFLGGSVTNWWCGVMADPCHAGSFWYIGLTCRSSTWRMFWKSIFFSNRCFNEFDWNSNGYETNGAVSATCSPFIVQGFWPLSFVGRPDWCNGNSGAGQASVTVTE